MRKAKQVSGLEKEESETGAGGGKMRKARILFNTSKGSFEKPGGGEVQLLETKKALEKLGFEIKILEHEGQGNGFSGFDLFHNFNIHRDNCELVANAKSAGLKVAVSTIYWPSLGSALLWNAGLGRKAKALGAELLNRTYLPGLPTARKIVRKADLLLPNSLAEAAALEMVFSAGSEKIFVVPNGVEERFAAAKPEMFEERFGLRDFALYVGWVEERKNVLSLVKAMKGLDEKLVIVGGAKRGSEAYMQKCRKAAGSNVRFLEPMPHESSLLESAYAACKVFALPSWYETPGLAALEAGLAGANVVVTREGCAREYFGEMASYVRPDSIEDIREKVKEGLGREKSPALKRHIAKRFLWGNAARATEAAYETVLGDS